MRVFLNPLILLVFTSGCTFSMANQTLRTQKESVPAAGLTMARLETGAGSLTINGQRGASTIEVFAEYKAAIQSESDAERILNNLKLTMEVRGSTFYLKSEQLQSWNWGNSGRIDLTITLPPSLSLEVNDGSGSIMITGMDRPITIEDGSGEIEVDHVRGNLRIDDGSGEIRILDIDGDVDVSDRSGEITVRRVEGSVHIRDGSGGIEVEDVSGDLIIPDEGSGSLRYRDIRGRVDVPKRR